MNYLILQGFGPGQSLLTLGLIPGSLVIGSTPLRWFPGLSRLRRVR
jgi:hypothetical protein